MKLVWSALALSDRDGIFTHIEADNPSAAVTVDERIAEAARRLREFPESGRPGRIAGTRELVITGTHVLFRLAGDQFVGPVVRRSGRGARRRRQGGGVRRFIPFTV